MSPRVHESFAFLERRLARYPADYGATSSPLEADGGWRATYELVLPTFVGGIPKLPEDAPSTQVGKLELSAVEKDGGVEMNVRKEVVHDLAIRHVVEAELECGTDALGSLSRWRVQSTVEGSEPRRAWSDRQDRASWLAATGADASTSLTCEWSLIDALQRRSGDAPPDGPFELLEDLELRRREQRLEALEPTILDIGGAPTELFGCVLFGEAVPLRYFWSNEAGRLLFVLDSLWALLLAPDSDR